MVQASATTWDSRSRSARAGGERGAHPCSRGRVPEISKAYLHEYIRHQITAIPGTSLRISVNQRKKNEFLCCVLFFSWGEARFRVQLSFTLATLCSNWFSFNFSGSVIADNMRCGRAHFPHTNLGQIGVNFLILGECEMPIRSPNDKKCQFSFFVFLWKW